MKTLAIQVDIRNSKYLNLDQKKIIYKDLYTTFRKFLDKDFNTIGFRNLFEVGDGIILVYNVDNLKDSESLYNLLWKVNDNVDVLLEEYDIEIGSGISYSESFDWGNNMLIAPSIDGASVGSNLAMKCKVKDKVWRWVLPLTIADDGDNSLQDLKELIQNDDKYEWYESHSGKNLLFEII